MLQNPLSIQELCLAIFKHLHISDIKSFSRTCAHINTISKCNDLWTFLLNNDYNCIISSGKYYESYKTCHILNENKLNGNLMFNFNLDNVGNIKCLDLRCNDFKRLIIMSQDYGPNKLVYVDTNNSYIPLMIPSINNMLSCLQILDLSYNKLTSFSTSLCHLINLRSLNLHQNELTFLPYKICNLKHLTFLGLSKNNLEHLPPEICTLHNLIVMYVNDNKLRELPKQIHELSNLSYFDVNNNVMRSLPCNFNRLNLNYVDLRNNNNDLYYRDHQHHNFKQYVPFNMCTYTINRYK